MKPYPAYKDSGIEWIGEIPEHWEEVQLKRCLKGVSNGTTANQQDYITDYPVSRIETISSGKIDMTRVGYLDEKDVDERFILNKGDILLSHINSLEYVGNCAIHDSDNLLVSGMNLLRLQPNPKIVPVFLLHYLKNHLFKNQVQANSKHAINQVSVPSSSLKSFRIILPPKSEQKSIANHLDRKTQQIDTLIEKKQKQIGLLKEQRTAIINQAITKGLNPKARMKDSGIEWLGEIPAHWKTIQLRRCLKGVSNGTTATQQDYITDYPVSRIETISSGIIDMNKVGYLDENDVDERFILNKGDILLSHINSLDYVGNCAIHDSDNLLVSGMNLLRLQPNSTIIPKFLLYYLKNYLFKNQIQSISKHAINQVSVPASSFKALKILLQSKTEQREIVDFLDRKTQSIDILLENINHDIELFQEYRTALISEVVSGKIDVRDEAP